MTALSSTPSGETATQAWAELVKAIEKRTARAAIRSSAMRRGTACIRDDTARASKRGVTLGPLRLYPGLRTAKRGESDGADSHVERRWPGLDRDQPPREAQRAEPRHAGGAS